MADSNKTAIGSRDDLDIDASRCLRMRFSESSCRHCVNICPHEAVSLDGFLAINPVHCTGCLLCTAVCPVGALEQNNDFFDSLSQLSRIPDPVLGCFRTKEQSNTMLACLGGLSEEHLVALCHSLSGKLTLNLTVCSDCSNRATIPYLHQRIEVLSENGLLEGGCKIVTVELAQDINCRDESVDRRSFFKYFRNSLFQSAAVILSTSSEPAERRTEYAWKRGPKRRELLNRTRKNLSKELGVQIRKNFDSYIAFDKTCTRCQGCVAICPSGALKTEAAEETPIFEQLLCAGCGACQEFCLDGALIYTRNLNNLL